MRKGIWATYFHKISTDENPQHMFRPECSDSWCDWQCAKTNNELDGYIHKPPLHPEVQVAIKPICEDLNSPALLKRCVGGHTQNNNESYNAVIWQMAPKHINSGAKIVNIAAYLTACFFNQGNKTILPPARNFR
ncbi:hypothetical protein WH47_05244 [Habropoda laboriosa]|uniref:Uncharacterized protein n=1 Tax=Habropoda laboriosa TaxID=597456 RepID=A0A0L7RKB0_9HYME|nr:hypothetical protein WH47_05244 [Habropoda laboriosa]